MSRIRILYSLLAAVACAGCLGRSVESKSAGSALWVASDSGVLSAAEQTRLTQLSLREIFLDAGDLAWEGAPAIRRRKLPSVPKRSPSTLVVHGAWLAGKREAAEVAEALHTELLALRIEAEQSGVLVSGYHLEIQPGSQGEHYAETLRGLRRRLAGSAYLSVGIDRRQLDGPQAKAIAAAADFVVCFLYGQRPGEVEDPTAWDLEEVERNFRRLENLRRPYLTGAITLGTAYLRTRDGAERAQTTTLAMRDLVRHRTLELKPGFSLQGVDRQVWEFVAQGPARVGEWSLERGESIRVVRTATPLVEEFRRRVGAWESSLRLGEIYYRLPRPEERLSLSAQNLETVLGPESATLEVVLSLARSVKSRELWVVTARLENRSAERSDLAYFENNYVQIQVDGALPVEAQAGEFRRSEILHDGDRSSMQALRNANQVRLFLPYVDEDEVAESGPITFRLLRADPEISISASFLLPEGRLLSTDPIEWSFDLP